MRWLLIFVLLAGCALPPAAEVKGPAITELVVVDFGYHAVIVAEGAALRRVTDAELRTALDQLGPAPFYEFGWGDRDVLLNTPGLADLRFGQAVPAALWPTPAVMKVVRRSGDPLDLYRHSPLVRVPVSDEGLEGFAASLSMSMTGRPGEEGGFSPGALNFETEERYIAGYTCNSWVSERLRAAGVPGVGSVLSSGVMRDLKRLGYMG